MCETRQTGRSTALALKALGEALQNPGYSIYIKDHHNTQHAHRELLNLCKQMAEKLNLKYIEFNLSNTSITYRPLVLEYQWIYKLCDSETLQITTMYYKTEPHHIDGVLGPAEWTKRYANFN